LPSRRDLKAIRGGIFPWTAAAKHSRWDDAAANAAGMAKLYFHYATMNAGKTTMLLQASYNYRERGMTTMLFVAGHYRKDDAAGYMAKTNGVAFPAFGEDEWMAMARRTFRERDGVPQLDYDPAISVVLSKPPSRFAGWIAGLLFRKLARKRPTLLLRGELSDVISADIASRMQRVAPGMQRVDIPKVGHAPMLTEPSAVDAIRNFLRTVP